MNIIDSDLLSIQQSRILIEDANLCKQKLLELPEVVTKDFEKLVINYFKENMKNLIKNAHLESDYGNPNDELALAKYYLANIYIEFEKTAKIGQVIKQSNLDLIGIPKGICVTLLPAYLPILTAMNNILLAIHTLNPIIVVPNKRCKNEIIKMVEDIQDIAVNNFYPQGAILVLKHIACKGIEELIQSKQISLVIEHRLCEDSIIDSTINADGFSACIGNNIVFVEKTANLPKCSKDIITSKSFNNGLLPGVEQSIVVETDIYSEFKNILEKDGAYFLSEDEQKRLANVIYDEQYRPRKELIGKSSQEIAKIAGIKINDNTQVLVVTKPYVSLRSPYSKEKYHPIISLYIEDDWRHACEKCIELILNDQKGQSLSIYTTDPYVIEQFIAKKPVAKILINTSTGFGSVGLTSNLPISFSLSTKQVAGVASKSLISDHFMFFREIGSSNGNSNNILNEISIDDESKPSLFMQMAKEEKEN